MSFKYKNITNTTQTLAVVSEDKTSVSHMSVEPGAIIEVNANLDIYVPHILAKLDASDVNISHLVTKARQELKEVVEKVKTETAEVVEKVETAVAVVKSRKNKKN